MSDTTIEWAEKSWNPIRGCSRVSEGCRHCYAERVAARFSGPGQPYEGLAVNGVAGPRWTGEVAFIPEKLAEPLTWGKPSRVFVNSMSDLFHPQITFEQIAAIFGIMAAAPRHTFIVLTKRPERAVGFFEWVGSLPNCRARLGELASVAIIRAYRQGALRRLPRGKRDLVSAWPLQNVILGVSAENQETADERIPLILQCPAAVRAVSAEPLLGPIDFGGYLYGRGRFGECLVCDMPVRCRCADPFPGVDWVIVGGESGHGARPCALRWIQSIVDQCQLACVPVFVKQLGARPINEVGATYILTHPKGGGELEYWPAPLRVRELPGASS